MRREGLSTAEFGLLVVVLDSQTLTLDFQTSSPAMKIGAPDFWTRSALFFLVLIPFILKVGEHGHGWRPQQMMRT
jgi:hypothetical protein